MIYKRDFIFNNKALSFEPYYETFKRGWDGDESLSNNQLQMLLCKSRIDEVILLIPKTQTSEL